MAEISESVWNKLKEKGNKTMGNHVITIGRQFGSGGREIGKKLAAELGVECYDSCLIDMAAEYGEIDPAVLKRAEEKKASSLLYTVYHEMANEKTGYGLPLNDMLFNLQSEVIRQLAEKESCIIIGRCADYVLAGKKRVHSVFIYADMEMRIDRIMKKYEVSRKEAITMIKKKDKERSSYYNFFTDRKWGQKESYDITINSSSVGIDGAIQIMKELFKLP